MLKSLRNKFAAHMTARRIDIQHRSLAEDDEGWEPKSFETVDQLREHMSFFVAGQMTRPWGFIIRDADLNGLDLTGLDNTRQWISKEAADLRGVDFTGVDVNSCRFDGANIEGATFTRPLVRSGVLAKTSGKPLMESGMGAAQMHRVRHLRRQAP